MESQQDLYTFGMEAFENNDPIEAIKFLEQVIYEPTEFALQALINVTWICHAAGQIDKGLKMGYSNIDDYSMYKDFGDVWENMTMLHMAKGEQQKAIEALENALEYTPNNIKRLMIAGSVYQDQLNDAESARSMFLRALELEPENSAVLSNLNIVHCSMDAYREAIEYGEKAVANDPEHLSGYINHAVARINLQDFYGAYRLMTAAQDVTNDKEQLAMLKDRAESCLEGMEAKDNKKIGCIGYIIADSYDSMTEQWCELWSAGCHYILFDYGFIKDGKSTIPADEHRKMNNYLHSMRAGQHIQGSNTGDYLGPDDLFEGDHLILMDLHLLDIPFNKLSAQMQSLHNEGVKVEFLQGN